VLRLHGSRQDHASGGDIKPDDIADISSRLTATRPYITQEMSKRDIFARCAKVYSNPADTRGWNILSICSNVVFPLPHGYVIQHNQVSYAAHVTPIPVNLHSPEAASFLCGARSFAATSSPRRTSAVMTGCLSCILRVEVKSN
jgi:hypothetical protein